MNDDPELRGLFQASREEDEATAPPFRESAARRPRHGLAGHEAPAPRLFAPALLVVILLGLTVVIAYRPRRTDAPTVPQTDALLSIPRWTAPTDFLLETPGRELFAGTPRIEAPPLPHDDSSEPKKGTRT